MLYKLRWPMVILVLLVILVLGAIIDLVPRWQLLTSAQQNARNFQAKLAALPTTRAVTPVLTQFTKKYLLPIITNLATQQNVTIKTSSESNNQQIHFAARGNYSNMLLFITVLLKQHHATFSSFTYQAMGNNEVRLVADVTLQPNSSGALLMLQPHNPFCGQANGGNYFSARDKNNRITLDLQNTNLSDTVRMLAKMMNRNVIVSPAVEGSVTLHVQQAKPASVFDLLLDSYGLETLKRDNVWYVAPRDELIKSKQQAMKWQGLTIQTSELITETWQIRYGKADDIARMLQNGKNTFLSERGQVRVDARTNIICVQDVPERIAAIRRLIAKLDQPSPQVRIEARLVGVDCDFERELGVDFSVQGHDAANVVPGRYSIAVARLPDGSMLDVKLAALETQGHAELMSSPSLYTENQQPAAIEAGEEVPYQEVSESGGTAVVFKKAVLSLKVTPQVLPNGYVLLQLRINQDRPSSHLVLGMPTISTRQILTSVLVKSGQTAVLGGIYENQDEHAVRRIPILGSVPVVGELFTLRARRQAKRQLLIFVTPKIMTQPL